MNNIIIIQLLFNNRDWNSKGYVN